MLLSLHLKCVWTESGFQKILNISETSNLRMCKGQICTLDLLKNPIPRIQKKCPAAPTGLGKKRKKQNKRERILKMGMSLMENAAQNKLSGKKAAFSS